MANREVWAVCSIRGPAKLGWVTAPTGFIAAAAKIEHGHSGAGLLQLFFQPG
jgi:hypothetical protein